MKLRIFCFPKNISKDRTLENLFSWKECSSSNHHNLLELEKPQNFLKLVSKMFNELIGLFEILQITT